MTSKDIFRAMRNIDMQLILDAAPPEKKKIPWTKWLAIAACFCIIAVGAFGYYNVVLRGANAPAPASVYYETLAELNSALGKETLYDDSNINADNGEILSIHLSCAEGENGEPDPNNPYQAKIRQKDGDIYVYYYIIFNRGNVNKSYIGGYEEQDLRLEINGITVHYSKIFDGSHHGQAKFIYDGDIYVIDVTSPEDNFDIRTYIDRILKEE